MFPTIGGICGLLLLALPQTPASLHSSEYENDETISWNEVKGGEGKPNFAKMADFAVRHYTTAVEYYLAVNKLQKVQQKGHHYKLTFFYTPTRCPVTKVFEPELCVATSAKPSGKCQAFVTEMKKGPFVNWIDCEGFDKKESPRAGVQLLKKQRRSIVPARSSSN
ncbi:uncharacterized protein LOC142588996 [Dermacentor variabilis]|uniref:uncharacterized protein LOC142588996 n=1 Tax=Dermacentor variabilis TaxID=34621 RepID=UPI003F5B6FBF